MDGLAIFKEKQKEIWAFFAPLETLTTAPAGRLVRFAGVSAGQRVLDVGCGTGVVSITAARRGAQVTGVDLTPVLLQRARENQATARVQVDWREADAEALPFEDRAFDLVLSQFGHMFAPRPAVVMAEMLRVLKPGGTIAFATWPPELLMGRVFGLVGRHMPPPPIDVPPPTLWGDPNVVRERLGTAVTDLTFDRDRMLVPVLSPEHHQAMNERTAGPLVKLVETLASTDPDRLVSFRSEYIAIVREYFEDNVVRGDYLITRAVKK